MSGLLTGGIADIANKALGGIMYPVVVMRAAQTPTAMPWEPVSTSTESVTFKGFISSYSTGMVDGERVQANDRKIIVLVKSASNSGFTPQPGDKAVVSGVVYVVVRIETDPAQATITMQARM